MVKTVLIVEDNELNMKLLTDLLQAKGYQTLQDKDGSEAINIARRDRPDLILMDIRLPGISGLDITRVLKDDAELKAIPVVAVTAFSSKSDEEKCLGGGCDGYIAKPIIVASFLQTIAKFLG
jgi:two-component system, cell cycle response regulator DivK